MAGASFWREESRDGSEATRPMRDWLTRSSESVAWRLDEFGKELSIRDHRTAHIFRRRLPPFVANGDVVAGAVVFNHTRMIDRDVGHALLPVGHGIPTSRHH